MTTFDELILKRRSIRKFDAERKVTREQLEEIIRAAQEAPSWNNFQASHYHVVMSEDVKSRLAEAFAPFDAKICADAPAVVVMTFERGRAGFKGGEPVDELGDGWGIYDLGLHNAFFLLKAADLGLDTIVLGLRDAGRIKAVLGLPEAESVVSFVAVGYRAKDSIRPKRKALDEIATFY